MILHRNGPINVAIGLGWIMATVAIAESIRLFSLIEPLGIQTPILYIVVFAALPTVVVGVIASVFTMLFPSFDGLLNLGSIGYKLSAASATPAIKTRNRYVEWRRPSKPDDDTATIEQEFDVTWFNLEFDGGRNEQGLAYKIVDTGKRINFWRVSGHQEYGLVDMFIPYVGSDGTLSVEIPGPTYGWDKSNISEIQTGYKRTDTVTVTCDLSYQYNFWRNEWVKTIEDYTVKVEEGGSS